MNRRREIWAIPSPYKSGAQKPHIFDDLELNGKFSGLYLRSETYDIHNLASTLENTKGLLRDFKM